MKFFWTLLFLAFLSSTTAHAVTPGCAKAVTRLDKALCASPELAAANDQVAAALKDALAKAPAEFADRIRADQSAWRRNATAACNVRKGNTGCLITYFNDRTPRLEQLLTQLGVHTFVGRSAWVSAKDKPAPAPSADDCDLDSSFGYSTLTAGWPELAGDTPETKALNQAIEAAARNFDHRGAKGPINTWAQALGQPHQNVIAVGVTLLFVGKNMITATIERANPGHCQDNYSDSSTRAFNWLLAEQRELEAKDIFIPTSDWKKTFESAFRKAAEPALHGSDLSAAAAAADLKFLLQIYDKPQHWKLEPDGFSIAYSEVGVLTLTDLGPITIPWDELKSILQPTFEMPVDGMDTTNTITGGEGL